jgi:hypothetical protein
MNNTTDISVPETRTRKYWKSDILCSGVINMYCISSHNSCTFIPKVCDKALTYVIYVTIYGNASSWKMSLLT